MCLERFTSTQNDNNKNDSYNLSLLYLYIFKISRYTNIWVIADEH